MTPGARPVVALSVADGVEIPGTTVPTLLAPLCMFELSALPEAVLPDVDEPEDALPAPDEPPEVPPPPPWAMATALESIRLASTKIILGTFVLLRPDGNQASQLRFQAMIQKGLLFTAGAGIFASSR